MRRNVLRVVFVLVLLAWGYALVYSVTRSEPEPLDDASVALLRDACADALGRLRTLDDLGPDAAPPDAAVLVRAENAVFVDMVAAMRTAEPTSDDGAAALAGWLDDWDALLAARASHADELTAGDTSGFDIPAARSGSSKPITVRMNEYAEQKGLDGCTPTRLRAEITDQPREWPAPDADAGE